MQPRPNLILAALCAFVLAACGSDDPAPIIPDAGADAADGGGDATIDDVGADALADGGDDTGDTTTTPDADAGTDAGTDATDSGNDTGTDTGVPPEVVTCAPLAPTAGRCDVTTGGDAVLVQGYVLGADAEYDGGGVLVDAEGDIACVGCDCMDAATAAGATIVSCPDSVVSPGLVNAHDHITFAQLAPVDAGDERYDHRHDWRKGKREHTRLSTPSTGSTQEVGWAALRQVLTGPTSIAGSGEAPGYLRNLDRSDGFDLGLDDVDYDTFPLGDGTAGTLITDSCAYPSITSDSVLDAGCYLPHVAEGIDDEARNEFLCLNGADGGVDIIGSTTTLVHAIGLTAADAAILAANGTAVVWSPRSNISLYGHTTPVTMYANMGIRVGLGTDWTPSGSIDLLRELACVDLLNQTQFGGFFSDRDLWLMATAWSADALNVDSAVGALREGMAGDIAVFATPNPTSPYRAVIDAGQGDVALVLRGGRPLVGDTGIVAGMNGTSTCEPFPGGICGQDLSVCAIDETGSNYAAMVAGNSGSYGIEFCGAPADEPTCIPFREGEFDGMSVEGDQDGDGVPDADDNCPTIFNAIRPLEGSAQADADADGWGDMCDPCPLTANSTECEVPNLDDLDNDGVLAAEDNCPDVSNPTQLDVDEDGAGDACDDCPEDANPAGTGCPISIYSVRQDEVRDENVRVTGEVSAIGPSHMFIQVPVADRDPVLGADFSGVMVYHGGAVEEGDVVLGDLVEVDAVAQEFFGQFQIANVRSIGVLETGRAAPEPLVVDAADVATGGARGAALEGLLIRVEDVAVTALTTTVDESDSDPNGEYEVAGALRVNDLFYATEPLPFVGDSLTITGVLRFGNGDLKIEPRDAADVVTVTSLPPTLVGFGPEVFVLQGATDVAGAPMPLSVTLNRAPTEAVTVTLSSDAEITLPTTVEIPAGETTADILITADAAAAGPYTVTAQLDETTLTATVQVLLPSDGLQVASSDPVEVFLTPGGTAEVTIYTTRPALDGMDDVRITVAPDDVEIATSALFHPVPLGTNSVVVTLTGVTEGTTQFMVGQDGSVDLTIPVTVRAYEPLGLVLSEVFYNPAGDDAGKEWIELFNDTDAPIDLSGYMIGSGGGDYTNTSGALNGTIPAGACFVIGGASSDVTLDATHTFAPPLQNSGSTADGIALFEGTLAGTMLDVVIYGGSNSNNLIGVDGEVAAVDVADAGSNQSIERTTEGWRTQETPTPGVCSVR